MQTTVARRVTFTGIGIHMGEPATVVVRPAIADSGIVFRLQGNRGRVGVPAVAANVVGTALSTTIGRPGGPSVATVEHLLGALAGLGIDNAVVSVDGPEIPVLDGSAAPFVVALDAAGVRTLAVRRRIIRVLRPVRIEHGAAHAELVPNETARCEIGIDFADPAIGREHLALDLTPARFRREVAAARTFGGARDVEALRKAGFARGASLENTIAVENGRVLNPEGLRWPDEFVRHKVLDAIGDLSLAGAPIVGTYRAFRGGHALNVAVIATLLADPSAYRVETSAADEELAARPGIAASAPALAGERA